MSKVKSGSCPHCKTGNIKKASPNLVCRNGYFICDKCYATKVVGVNEWVQPTRKVLYLDNITNRPIFELNQNKDNKEK